MGNFTQEEWDNMTEEQWKNNITGGLVINNALNTFGTTGTDKSAFSNISTPRDTLHLSTIRGKMVTVSQTFSDLDLSMLNDKELKLHMLYELCKELEKTNHVEFTRMVEPHTGNYVVRARIFATPDEQVRMIRLRGVD